MLGYETHLDGTNGVLACRVRVDGRPLCLRLSAPVSGARDCTPKSLETSTCATPAIPNTSVWATTQTQLATTAQSGYGLLGITLIVMAAVAILGALFVLIRGRED